jgi:hypothetical protein
MTTGTTLRYLYYELTADEAIAAAIADGHEIHKYADPIDGEEFDLTAERAEEIAREDFGLLYVRIEAEPKTAPALAPDYGDLEARAVEAITDPHDGPVTPFVTISRAIDAARAGKFPPCETFTDAGIPIGESDPIANALAIALSNMSADLEIE